MLVEGAPARMNPLTARATIGLWFVAAAVVACGRVGYDLLPRNFDASLGPRGTGGRTSRASGGSPSPLDGQSVAGAVTDAAIASGGTITDGAIASGGASSDSAPASGGG